MVLTSRVLALSAAFAAALTFNGISPAASQTVAATPPAGARPSMATVPRQTGPKVYLLRGLMNIFSLGMDDLQQKISARGVRAEVFNHSVWQTLCGEIGARHKAGDRSPIVLIGHSLGADAVMLMGECLDKLGVPVALIVPFDGTASHAASKNVQRVLNLTQRDYARISRGPGFRGDLVNMDVSGPDIGHISIDKSPRLHALVVARVLALGRGGGAPAAPKPGSTEAPVAAAKPTSHATVSAPAVR